MKNINKIKMIILVAVLFLMVGGDLFASGNSLNFDGTNDYVAINSVNVSGYPFTFSAWIKTGTIGSSDRVIVNIADNSSSRRYFGIFVGEDEGGQVCIRGRNGGHRTVHSTVTVDDNKWHHVVGVFASATDRTLYIDGISEATDSRNVNYSTSVNTTTIGRWGDSTPKSYFDGDIDEVQIWDIALSETQIREMMCKKITSSNLPTGLNWSSLKGYWRLDETSGLTASDQSSSNSDGTLTNMDTSDWLVSGAPIGDESTYDYTSPTSLNMSSTSGDDITVSAITGSPDAVQIYRVDSAPNVTTPPSGMGQLSQIHYFGTFVIGGTTPTYTLTYDYDGHSGITDEDDLDLAGRENNATTSWTDLNATLDTTTNTLVKTGQTSGEFILGSSGGDNPLPVSLTTFSANQVSNTVSLEWQTGSEYENLGFIIERRSDNEEYIEIATYSSDEELTGSGNSSVRSHYSFTDENVVSGTTYEYRISDVDYSGRLTILKSVTVQLVDNGLSGLPNAYALNKAYPNPFNATTTISYELPKSSVVTISVYDINGRFIEELVNENKDAGSHTVRWDASSVSSGVYLYRLVTSEFVSVNKCILLK